MANHHCFNHTLFYSSNKYVISYQIVDDRTQSQFERIIEEIGFTVVLKSPISMLLTDCGNEPFTIERWKRLREIRFRSEDIIELITTQHGALEFVRLKKRGNKTISLTEYRNAMLQNEIHQNV